MKKFFIPLIALLLVAATLVSTGCDTVSPQNPYHSTPLGNATLPPEQTSSGESTSQSSTKYSPATAPSQSSQSTVQTNPLQSSQSTTQTEPLNPPSGGIVTDKDITDEEIATLVTKKYLTVNEKSRPGYKLDQLKEIVIHYVANPGTSALQNWKYFENKNWVSAHFIIDLDGSILQCMPLDEVAWAIGTTEGNYSTISIECCHPDKTGKFTDATYESLVKLVSWLCSEYGLSADNVKRHYDYPRKNSSGVIWHKQCPLYFVDHPEKWEEFKNSLLIH